MLPPSKINLSYRVKLILADIRSPEEVPRCKFCGSPVTFNSKPPKDIASHCRKKECSRKSAVTKTKKVWDERYGGHPLSDKEILAKQKATNLERYGSENPNSNHEVREKIRRTNMERYGVENPAQSEAVKQKVRDTIYSRYGGYGVIAEKSRRTVRERYGVDSVLQIEAIREKIRQTNIDRYGVEYPAQSEEIKLRTEQTNIKRYGCRYYSMTEEARRESSGRALKIHAIRGAEILDKREQTNLLTYGVENPFSAESVKSKIKSTNRIKYGVENPSQAECVKAKKRETFMSNYGVPHYSQNHISANVMSILNSKESMVELYNRMGGLRASHELGVCDGTIYDYLKKHGIPIDETVGSSFAEREIADYVKSLVGDENVITSDRSTLNGKELDIYVPSRNLAIEFNGLFWHSTKFKNPTDHLDKTRACEKLGIHLIQIFEDEWYNTPEVIKKSIAVRLGAINLNRVYARKCKIVELSNSDVRDFYNNNHVQGAMNASIVYGLEFEDVLVAAMSFKENYGYMELTRYATSEHVIGGFSKLLKHFFKYNPDCERVVSFADRRWSQGDVYKKNGFKLTKVVRPNYFYVEGNERVRKQYYRHKYLDKKLDNYDPSKSEKENTEANGVYRIYDCGLLKFEITRGTLGL
tara:strand:- start:3358 stop:5280 length:1923 start_codon:yes stop_codon:yes gene_type:complete